MEPAIKIKVLANYDANVAFECDTKNGKKLPFKCAPASAAIDALKSLNLWNGCADEKTVNLGIAYAEEFRNTYESLANQHYAVP